MATTRIRSLKPDYFGSPDTARASWKARVLFPALWCWADDWGYGVTNVKAINAFAFEHDDLPDTEVAGLLREIAGVFGVVFYTHGGRAYFKIPSWNDHQKTQRRSQKRIPDCEHPDSVLDLRFHVPQGVSESSQGNSEGTQGNVPSGSGKGEWEREWEREVSGFASEPDDDAEPLNLPATIERDDVEQLCTHLRDRIIANGGRRKNITQGWRESARLLLDRDQVSLSDAHAMIDWCQDSEFWRGNVLSMPKFREKFDTLKMQAQRSSSTSSFGRRSMTEDVSGLQRAGADLLAHMTPDVGNHPTLALPVAYETDKAPF